MTRPAMMDPRNREAVITRAGVTSANPNGRARITVLHQVVASRLRLTGTGWRRAGGGARPPECAFPRADRCLMFVGLIISIKIDGRP